MSSSELRASVLASGVLGRPTAKRVNDIVHHIFAHRYLLDEAGFPGSWIKLLLDQGVRPSRLTQLLLLYTARVNSALHDFVCDAYWTKYSAGSSSISNQDAWDFLDSITAVETGPQEWSHATKERIGQALTGCLSDFGLTGKDRRGVKEILPFTIDTLTTVYLAHELHFTGSSDNSILTHPDWRLFGLEPSDTVQELKRVQNQAKFIVQFSGDLLRISWGHQSMEECLRDIAEQEL